VRDVLTGTDGVTAPLRFKRGQRVICRMADFKVGG
jgi:hypothetical protein